ncbi:hypothetical protein VTI74DRAFT_8014 [Chaetomium olivicolor]
MPSRMTSDMPARPATPVSPGSECHAKLVSLNVSTIEEILGCIVSARQSGTESILGFHWQASQVHDLSEQLDARLLELDQIKIRRFEYDYESETVYLDVMGESEFHYQVGAGVRRYIENRIAESYALATIHDPEIRRLMKSIKERGTFLMKYGDKLCKQADISFGPVGSLPSLVCEVS